MKLSTYIKGFFEESAPQSMTRLIALIITLSSVVYMLKTWDYIGTIAIFTTAGLIKVGGKKIGKQK